MWKKLLSRFKIKSSPPAPGGSVTEVFRKKYINFKSILESNSELLKIISDFEVKLSENRVFPMAYIHTQTARMIFHTARMIKSFERLSGRAYAPFTTALNQIRARIAEQLEQNVPATAEYVLPLNNINKEMVAAVGGKNANLGEVASLGIPIPRGFAITTTAFQAVIRENDLLDEIRKQKMALNVDDTDSIHQVSDTIQKLFLGATVPKPVEQAILDAYERFVDAKKQIHVALRSSAIGEDSHLSFAGQYISILNVPPDNIIKEYLKVLAGLFTPRAIFYRLHMGIPFGEADMSVGCLEMINAKTSGILYTSNPNDRLDTSILINASWGLGTYVVEGIITPDIYKISREPGHRLLSSDIADKHKQLQIQPDGYVIEKPVDTHLHHQPCLSPQQAAMLAEYAIVIEKHYQSPQDIEWAIDKDNRVILLQARPLRVQRHEADDRTNRQLPGYSPILENGNTACPGVGYGPAYPVFSEQDLKDFPEGGILVAAHSSPLYVMAMQKTSAIVIESGSVTGHMASLAREFQVPTLLNLKSATTVLKKGEWFTVDATTGCIYPGEVPELTNMPFQKASSIVYSPVYKALKTISGFVIPLNLLDPNSPAFTPENCRTVHDIMRFIHERSYTEMFNISNFTVDYGNISVKLNAALPIDLYVIDLGKGLRDRSGAKTEKRITIEDVTSVPFKAILSGMLHEGLAQIEPRPVSFKGFLSVMSEQMLSPPRNGIDRFGEKSFAIISDNYLNFSSRVGYHYSVLDAYCSTVLNMNYINFSFMGGAADYDRRKRRARLIQQVVQALEFLVEIHGDRVTARFSKQPDEIMFNKLNQLGRLLIYTRQMDMLMHTDQSIAQLAEGFLNENYKIKLP